MELVYNVNTKLWRWWGKQNSVPISPEFSTREEALDWHKKYELIFLEN